MTRVFVRFYEELNDFLPRHRRKVDFGVEFTGTRSVKDLVESLGPPHTEVDLIVVNGRSAGFSCLLRDGDRVSVYPTFESLDIGNVTRVRPVPLRKTRFIADTNLGGMVRYMRALGFDVDFDPALSAGELIERSRHRGRIILTGSRDLLKNNGVTHGILVRRGSTSEAIAAVLDRVDIAREIRPFSRCLRCNTVLSTVAKEHVAHRLPAKVKARFGRFARCPSCERIYWKGTHHDAMGKVISRILENIKKR